jgi:hypothetical protein
MTEWRMTETTPVEDPLQADRRRLWIEAFLAFAGRGGNNYMPTTTYAVNEANEALRGFDAKFGPQARSEEER